MNFRARSSRMVLVFWMVITTLIAARVVFHDEISRSYAARSPAPMAGEAESRQASIAPAQKAAPKL